jgi:tetratricopeptide (TPR) repeat protein
LVIDPNYALAYAGLSGSYGFLGNVYLPPNENFPKAKAYAAKALELDDSLAEAHGAMGAIRLFYDWDWAAQEIEFKRAQELSPSYGDAYQLYAAYLESAGRFDDALEAAIRAQEIDPLSAMFASEVGITHYFAGRYDKAIAQFESTLNLEPGYGEAYQYLGQSYEQKRMYARAITAFETGMARGERSPALISSLGHTYALSGDRSGAKKALAELRKLSNRAYLNPYFFAVVYAGLGDKDSAFKYLDQAFRIRSSMLIWLNVEPQFASLRDDPRFRRLIERIGIK